MRLLCPTSWRRRGGSTSVGVRLVIAMFVATTWRARTRGGGVREGSTSKNVKSHKGAPYATPLDLMEGLEERRPPQIHAAEIQIRRRLLDQPLDLPRHGQR